MKNTLKIFAFTIVVIAFYSYVGQMVPQTVTYPPEATELSADMTTEDMVEVGREIVEGKGTCLTCHTVGSDQGGGRFPDLGNIGAVAGDRREGLSDVEYLAESLYEPNVFVVEGYNPGMPPIAQPPIDLSDQEILAVIAYLQSLGGAPTVTMETQLEYMEAAPAAAPTADAPSTAETGGGAAAATGGEALSGPALFEQYLCNTCHSIDAPTPLVGPSLYDVGNRLTRAEIYQAIVEPDATIAEGYTAGVMPATLEAGGFYEQVTARQLQTLVDFLASQTGE